MIRNISNKIIVSIFIIIMFFVMILLKEYITNPFLVNAYQISNTNQVGSYPINFNKDNYYDINLLDTPNVNTNTLENGVTYRVENNTFYIKGTTGNRQGPIFYNNLNLILDPGTYTLSYFDLKINDSSGRLDTLLLYLGTTEWDNDIYLNNNPAPQLRTVFTLNETTIFNYLRCWSQEGNYDYSFKLMLYKGDYNPNINTYSVPFKFGYKAYISNLKPFNNSSSNINTTLNVYKCDNCNPIYTENYNIAPYTSVSITSNGIYLPFNINENGNISIYQYIKIELTNSSDYTYDYTGNIELVPIFQATPINNNKNNIKLKYVYSYNALSLSGVNLNVKSINNKTSNANFNLYEDSLDHITITNLKANNSYYITSNYVSDVILSDSIDINMFTTLYSNMTINYDIENTNYVIFSFDSYNLLINGNTSNTTPVINGSSTYEQYNTCSAWYDIPCQLSNGLTYVLYNVPVISPLIQLLKNIIDVVTSIVDMIKWYEGLGILFSLFILIFMIRIIIMLLKGSNDDRGGKK